MNTILLSPHSDDEALYCTYICLKYKPLVVVCYDGYQHQEKFNIPIDVRREETRQACKKMGVDVVFLGLDDRKYKEKPLIGAIRQFVPSEIVIAPMYHGGGNDHHNLVSVVAKHCFPRVIYYATYNKTDLHPKADNTIEGDIEYKKDILSCYKSQMAINRPHFDAVLDGVESIYEP